MNLLGKNGFDCLIVDEAHSIKRTNKVSKCIEKIKSEYKFGFTGTLAENEEDKFKNLGTLGPVRFEKTSKELRDEGFLSNVVVNTIDLTGYELFVKLKYKEEVNFLESSNERNEFIAKLSFKLNKNILILVNHLAHGFALEEVLNRFNDCGKKIYFIRGEVDTEIREEIKKLMEEEDGIICIAITKIFSTGINIKNLHNIVLAAGGKSSVTVVQSIGRGLRLHPNKKLLNIYDISESQLKFSKQHAESRRKIYATEKIKTKHFKVNISK